MSDAVVIPEHDRASTILGAVMAEAQRIANSPGRTGLTWTEVESLICGAIWMAQEDLQQSTFRDSDVNVGMLEMKGKGFREFGKTCLQQAPELRE